MTDIENPAEMFAKFAEIGEGDCKPGDQVTLVGTVVRHDKSGVLVRFASTRVYLMPHDCWVEVDDETDDVCNECKESQQRDRS